MMHPRWCAGVPKPPFKTGVSGVEFIRNYYDVSADGQRFLINTAVGQGALAPITVVVKLADKWPCHILFLVAHNSDSNVNQDKVLLSPGVASAHLSAAIRSSAIGFVIADQRLHEDRSRSVVPMDWSAHGRSAPTVSAGTKTANSGGISLKWILSRSSRRRCRGWPATASATRRNLWNR